jgi:hypothetical protein
MPGECAAFLFRKQETSLKKEERKALLAGILLGLRSYPEDGSY